MSSSRLFKHAMAMPTRPPVYPHVADAKGDIWQYKAATDTFTLLYSLGVAFSDIAYSPDGLFLSMINTSATAPYIAVYKRGKTGYSLITLPSAPNAAMACTAWSPDGKYLFICYSSGGSVRYWQRNADNSFTYMGVLYSPAISFCYAAAASPINVFASGVGSGNFLYFGLFGDAGTGTFTPDVKPTAAVSTNGMIWLTPNLLMYGTQSSPVALFYNVTPGSATKTTVTGFTSSSVYSVAVSPDGKHVMVGTLNGYDYYKFDSTTNTFTRLVSNTSVGRSISAAFSPDGNYVTLATLGATSLLTFKMVGDTLVLLPTLPNAPNGVNLGDVCFGTANAG